MSVEVFGLRKGNNGWRLDPQLAPFRQTKAARVECLSTSILYAGSIVSSRYLKIVHSEGTESRQYCQLARKLY